MLAFHRRTYRRGRPRGNRARAFALLERLTLGLLEQIVPPLRVARERIHQIETLERIACVKDARLEEAAAAVK